MNPNTLLEQDPGISDDLIAAMEVALSRFGPRDEVSGIDVGHRYVEHRDTGELVVRIHVKEKRPVRQLTRATTLPKRLDGVGIDILQGVYGFTSTTFRTRQTILRPGCSIGPEGGGTGTLGMFVKDQHSGRRALLSCAHVLFSGGAQPGQAVLQPGHDDGGRASHRIGEVERRDPTTDSAIALLDDHVDLDETILALELDIDRFRFPQVGDVLIKCGRSTGRSEARIDGLGHVAGLPYAMSLVPLDDASDPVSESGDSGAIWCTADGGAVGLQCKGERVPTRRQARAIATSVKIIGERLDIEVP